MCAAFCSVCHLDGRRKLHGKETAHEIKIIHSGERNLDAGIGRGSTRNRKSGIELAIGHIVITYTNSCVD